MVKGGLSMYHLLVLESLRLHFADLATGALNLFLHCLHLSGTLLHDSRGDFFSNIRTGFMVCGPRGLHLRLVNSRMRDVLGASGLAKGVLRDAHEFLPIGVDARPEAPNFALRSRRRGRNPLDTMVDPRAAMLVPSARQEERVLERLDRPLPHVGDYHEAQSPMDLD